MRVYRFVIGPELVRAAYEPPENPEIICHTAEETVKESVAKILAYLEEQAYVSVA